MASASSCTVPQYTLLHPPSGAHFYRARRGVGRHHIQARGLEAEGHPPSPGDDIKDTTAEMLSERQVRQDPVVSRTEISGSVFGV